MSRALNEVWEEEHPRQSRCLGEGPGAEARLNRMHVGPAIENEAREVAEPNAGWSSWPRLSLEPGHGTI